MSAEFTSSPEVSFCLVNYNDGAHLSECLGSIESHSGSVDFEVIVVDNGSQDGSPALLEQEYPWVRLFRNAENEGFGRAANRAAAASRGEYLLFLNTDVILFPGALGLLLEEMRARPEIGISGPALLNPGDKFQVSFGGRVNVFTEAFKKAILNRRQTRALRKNDRKREVVWVSGAFLLARRSAFFEAGLFDESFFMYFEDIDLCLRAAGKGWKTVFLPKAVSFHWGGATTSARPLASRLEYRKSQLYFYRKHNSRLSLFVLKLYLILNYAGLVVGGAFRKEHEDLRRGFRRLFKGERT